MTIAELAFALVAISIMYVVGRVVIAGIIFAISMVLDYLEGNDVVSHAHDVR